jgi:hypothetical protein
VLDTKVRGIHPSNYLECTKKPKTNPLANHQDGGPDHPAKEAPAACPQEEREPEDGVRLLLKEVENAKSCTTSAAVRVSWNHPPKDFQSARPSEKKEVVVWIVEE